MRGCQRGWQALHVFLGLELDARERVASGLGLHHTKGIAVYEEQVVDVTVALLQLELADCNAVARREIHILPVLNEPARLRQEGVDLLAGLGFRRVLAASWRHIQWSRHARRSSWGFGTGPQHRSTLRSLWREATIGFTL